MPTERLRLALERDWGRKPSDVWWYWDVNGYRSFAVVRFDDVDGKKYYPFCWVRSATSEGWKARSLPAPRPLFNLNRLAARPDAPVLVVEGEKCVRDAEKVFPDWVVVTSPGGAHAAAKTDWPALAGRPEARIWPDADKAGSDYATDVGLHLQNVGVSNIRVVDAGTLASRMPDGTTRDAVEEGWSLDVLREAVFANATRFEAGPRYVSFDTFVMDEHGLKVAVPKGNGDMATFETKWVCAPFEILGRARAEGRGVGTFDPLARR